MRLYALTIRQPFASYIASGRKRIETRAWATHHRGLLVIHAALRPRVEDLPRQAFVAVARLVDVVRVETLTTLSPRERAVGDFRRGRFAWLLFDVRVLPTPIPYPGQQGLWPVDAAMSARVLTVLSIRKEN